MKIIMYPHAGSGNHGCEAIVRTTELMISEKDNILFSDGIAEDKRYKINQIIEVVSPKRTFSRFSMQYLSAQIKYRLLQDKEAFDKISFTPIVENANDETVLLSIGGDNYCYGDNEYIYLVNRLVRNNGAKTVLWGCSVEPNEITSKMKEDLVGYDYIVARESISYEALKKINQNTVLYPDPAFTLKKTFGEYPEGLGKKPYIGINLSPLIQKRENIKGITLKNYELLIENILKKTEFDIALIPHVVKIGNDDRIPLKKLCDEFVSTNRVFLVEDQNCMQLKDIISNCKVFIGARTHATIAAYSTCVPTLVVGYSVKARGIAKDLFGTDENYVIPVQSLKNESDLTNAFNWILENETQISIHLNEIMPRYISRAFSVSQVLEEVSK